MAERPESHVSIRQWPGLQSNVNPLLRPPGASGLQINCRSLANGVLEVRNGFRPCGGQATSVSQIISLYLDLRGSTTNIISHHASGVIGLNSNVT